MGEIVWTNRCKYRFCGTPLVQSDRGRKREYCDDVCRQAEHRARQADAAKEAARQEVASWGEFLPATIDQLAGYITAGSRDTARKLADIILAEQQASRRKKPMGQADLAELERARADLLQLRKENNRASEEIHRWVERCKDLKMDLSTAQHKIKDLESQAGQSGRGSDQVRDLYQTSITAAEQEKAAAQARVKDLESQLEQARRGPDRAQS